MIDIERIDTAYHRFKAMHDSLVFRAQEYADKYKGPDGKDVDYKRVEIRCNNRVVYTLPKTSTLEDGKKIAETMNKTVADFIEGEYDFMLNEIKEAEVPLE